VSENFYLHKGDSLEVYHSSYFHKHSVPILISPQVLRRRNLGQIDLIKLKRDQVGWVIELAEVKSSHQGLDFMQKHQKFRLLDSAKFVSGLLGTRIKFTALVG
jgi:hypothetical protein